MKITRRQLRQVIKEESQTRDWTSFDDAKMASLESTSEEPVYYRDRDDFVHTLVNGVVKGNSHKAPHGSRTYLNYKRAAKKNPGAYFNFTAEEETIAEGTKMKITRKQLRQLINEELNSINEDATNLPTLEELQSLERQVLRIIKPVYDRAFNTDHTLKYPEGSFHGRHKKVEKLLSKFRERNEMWGNQPHDFLGMLYFLKAQLGAKQDLG